MIAEKLEALTALETLNSRMKDFFDLWALSAVHLPMLVRLQADSDDPCQAIARIVPATLGHDRDHYLKDAASRRR